MLTQVLTLVACTVFAGAAIYVNVAEQPARLALADGPMLAQWQASYPRAAIMQSSLAIAGGVLGDHRLCQLDGLAVAAGRSR